jgi:YggT family protein
MTAQENVAVDILCVALTVFWLLLLLRVILSWARMFGFRPPLSGPLRGGIDLLDTITEPVLQPLRAVLPRPSIGGMGLDLSVLVAFVILLVLQRAFC